MDNTKQTNQEHEILGQIEVDLRSALYKAEELKRSMLSYLLKMAMEELKSVET